MIQKINVKTTSQTYDWIIKGIEKFGDNYRHQWQGKHYKIINAKLVERQLVEFTLQSVI